MEDTLDANKLIVKVYSTRPRLKHIHAFIEHILAFIYLAYRTYACFSGLMDLCLRFSLYLPGLAHNINAHRYFAMVSR